MIPRTLRELLQASKRTAREIRQTLEDVGELLREGQQAQPVRVPVRPSSQHPLARKSASRRNFSTFNATSASNLASSTLKFRFANFNSTSPLKRALFTNFSSFRSAYRPFNGGIGKGLFSCFPKHNARSFSTFSPNAAHQIVENLSQNVRMFFLKGGKLSKDMLNNNSASTSPYQLANESSAEHDLKLASRFSDVKHDSGCIIEFDFSAPLYVPEAGIFDDESSLNLQTIFESNMKHQTKIMNDITMFKEKIGSTSFKFNKGKNRLRFYCPNCDVIKMELLLKENGISTGIVYKNDEIDDQNQISTPVDLDTPELLSPSSSEYSDYSNIDSDIISSADSLVENDYYFIVRSGEESNILSTSEEYAVLA